MGQTASTDDSDESLMRLIRQGSHQAFAILVRRHTDRFFAGAFRMSGNAQEAEDMIQDAFLKIWQNPDVWKEDRGAKFTTWFYRILVNANIDRLRRSQKMTAGETILPFIADARANPEQSTAETEEQRKIEKALSTLPERQKTALTLCFYEGLSNAEAADAMGVKVKALESLLMRAKTGLREYLKQNHNPQQGGLYAAR
jgi:RNA polymerase sigma-70 factor (ECF subfamily)